MRQAICATRLGMLLVLTTMLSSPANAQQPANKGQALAGRENLREPIYRIAQAPMPVVQVAAAVPRHPLDPALKKAREGLASIDANIQDYTCTFVKRERINGRLLPHEYMYCKFRLKPFSVYMYFLKPEKVKGREVIYVEGKNVDRKNVSKLIGHGTSAFERAIGRVHLKPTSPLAMKDNRYPITEAGMRNLIFRLIEVGQRDRNFSECEVKFYQGAKVDNNLCTVIQVVHPVPRKNFTFHVARIYIDDERQIPLRFESYTWPKKQGGKPVLLEEYTYMNVKLNVGLKDSDFDPDNPNYHF